MDNTRVSKKVQLAEEYKKKLKSGEQYIMEGSFSAIPAIFIYFGAALAALIISRLFLDYTYVMLLANLFMMYSMFEAARVLIYAQNSCLIITSQRIYGISGERKFDIPYNKVKGFKMTNKIAVSGGSESAVLLKQLKNMKEVKVTLEDYLK